MQQEKEKKFDKFSHLHSYSGDSKTGWAHRVKQRHGIKIEKLLNQYIPQNADILEIGPGQGYFAGPITSGNNRYDAIEPSRSFRRALQDLGFQVTEEAVPPIERPSCSYDLIHASMVIENLPTSNEAGNFSFEAARVLKPGGILCLIFPNYLVWGSFFFEEQYTHSFPTSPRRVQHMLECQGFVLERMEYVLGWFWVEGNLWRNVVRHLANVCMRPFHTRLAHWCFSYLGLGELHWKIRKTVFEAVVVIARKPFN